MKLKKKAALLYLLGMVVILWVSFSGVDTANTDELISGAVFAVGWMFIMLVLYWIDKQRLLPWRDMNL